MSHWPKIRILSKDFFRTLLHDRTQKLDKNHQVKFLKKFSFEPNEQFWFNDGPKLCNPISQDLP